VEEVEVEDVEAEFRHGLLERLHGQVIGPRGVPELAGDEHLGAGPTGLPDGGAHGGLVAVDRGGVDMPVAQTQGCGDRANGVRAVLDLPGAESKGGDGDAVGEGE